MYETHHPRMVDCRHCGTKVLSWVVKDGTCPNCGYRLDSETKPSDVRGGQIMKAEIKSKQVDDEGHVIIELIASSDSLSPFTQNALGYLGSELGLGPNASYEALCDTCGRERAEEMVAGLLMEECANVASGSLVLPIACAPKLKLSKPYAPGGDLEFSFESYLLPRGQALLH